MLWIRGLVFTALVPGVIGFVLPSVVDPHAARAGGPWNGGWLLVGAGSAIYIVCLMGFVSANGTPAIFFSRHLRFVIGEEPDTLVSSGLYRVSRNPMYVGVLMVVFGQAVAFASGAIAVYGAAAFLFFHLTVVLAEEPHLRAMRGESYARYCRDVPRWIGW